MSAAAIILAASIIALNMPGASGIANALNNIAAAMREQTEWSKLKRRLDEEARHAR